MDKMELSEMTDRCSVGPALESTSRQSEQRRDDVPQIRLHRVEARTKIIGIPAPTCKNCVKESRGMRVQRTSRVCAWKAGWKMGMDEEVDSKKIRIKTRKICKNQSARSPEFHVYAAGHPEQAQRTVTAGAPQYIEQKRNDLLPRASKQQKRSQEVTELAGQKETIPKRMLINEIEKWSGVETRLQNETFSSKTWKESSTGMCSAEAELDEELRNLQAGEEKTKQLYVAVQRVL